MGAGNNFYGEFIALLTALSWSVCVFPFTEAARRIGPDAVNILRLIVAFGIQAIILAVYYSSFNALFSVPTKEEWLWLGLSGVFGFALSDFFGFTAYAILGPRLGSLFGTIAPAVVLFSGYIFLNETINVTGIGGIMMTIAGLVWLLGTKAKTEQEHDYRFGSRRKAIVSGLLAAICGAVGVVLAKKAMVPGGINPMHATWLRLMFGTAGMLLYLLVSGKVQGVVKAVMKNERNGVYYALWGTLFGPFIGVCLSMYALSLVEATVAQTIFSIMPVLVLPLGYFFYRQRITRNGFLGAAVAVAGVLILIWRNEIAACLIR